MYVENRTCMTSSDSVYLALFVYMVLERFYYFRISYFVVFLSFYFHIFVLLTLIRLQINYLASFEAFAKIS